MENSINLETFAGGALAERANQAIHEVMENIADINTESKPKRKVTIEMVFESDEDREKIAVTITAKTKIVPRASVAAKIILDKTLEGELIASEYKKQIPGQQCIKVDTETGEILELSQEQQGNVGLEVIK